MTEKANKTQKVNSIDSNPTKVIKTITITQNSLIYIVITLVLVILGITGGILYANYHNKNNGYSNSSLRYSRSSLLHSKLLKNTNFGVVNEINSSSLTILDKSASLVTYNITSLTKVISQSTGQSLSISGVKVGNRVVVKTFRHNPKDLKLIVIRTTSSVPSGTGSSGNVP